MMEFRLDPRKAIEASATLLRLTRGKCMSRKRLLALLYLADRESLRLAGRPIIGGRLVAMNHGPIHSEVYDFIKGGRVDQAQWSECFQNDDNYSIELVKDPGVSALSRAEVSLLNEISRENAGVDVWDVAEKTHQFAEYEKNYHKNTSTTIPLGDVIDAVGRGSDKDAIFKDAQEKAYADRLFAARQ